MKKKKSEEELSKMLKQILHDMFIDPELLSELDEEQKQVLFCKMREEQIRRWREKEEQLEQEEKKSAKNKKIGPTTVNPSRRKVEFKMGSNGEPWTWVMGEHPNDKSIEQMLEEEAQEKARSLAEQEALAALKKIEESEMLSKKVQDLNINEIETKRTSDDEDTPNSEILPVQFVDPSPIQPLPPLTEQPKVTEQPKLAKPEPNILRRKLITDTYPGCLASLKEKRSSEIYATMQLNRQKSIEEAEKDGKIIENFWKEQERKSRLIEEEKRFIAKRAREDHRKSLRKLKTESQIIGVLMTMHSAAVEKNKSAKPVPGAKSFKGKSSRPATKEEAVNWFREMELMKGSGCDPVTKQLAPYFHGTINRPDAERLLTSHPIGSFLIRLSDKVWGYALSYKGEHEKIRHYLIDVTEKGYQFFGTNQIVHRSLAALISYYEQNPLSLVDQEMLKLPLSHDQQRRKECEDLIAPTELTADVEVSHL